MCTAHTPHRSQYAVITLTTSCTASTYILWTKCVIFGKVLIVAPWWWFPCKPKYFGAVLLILKCFNNSTFFNVVCVSWLLKCWRLNIFTYIGKAFLTAFIHPFRSLSYDRSIASYKATSPQSPMKRFLFQFPVPCHFLKVTQCLLSLLPHFPITPNPPSIPCFRRQFLGKMWPVQLVVFLFSCPPCLYVILYFSHDRSNWSSPSFTNAPFRNFPDISDLLT